MENQMWLLLAHALIGIGFFFIYIFHVRSIFESRTNVAHMSNQLEREALFRREDALYYDFYKIVIEEHDFMLGYEKLSNITSIEYPTSVNVLKRFEILPELLFGYLYHNWRYLTGNAPYPFANCWRSQDIRMPVDYRECDISGQPMQFYLEMVWLLGGITVFVIYIYGMFLSEHLFGGIYSVIAYFMFHKYASKIYDRPLARENFAFPFIFLQMLYVTTSFGNMFKENIYKSRITNIFILTWVTAIALSSWQLSSIIFISQICIAYVPWVIQSVPLDLYSKFAVDLAISQIMGNFLAFFISWGNPKHIYSWTFGPAVGLLSICYCRKIRVQQQQQQLHEGSLYMMESQPIRFIILGALTASTVQGAIIDIAQKWGSAPVFDSTYTLYRDLLVHWILPARINFVTSLAACNPHFEQMNWIDLWDLVKTLFVKPYCMYGVVMLAEFFRKWRKNNEKKTPNDEKIERAKKYVLEDFLEENHISMREMSNKDTEDDLSKCLKLLQECNYDYDNYKLQKSKIKKSNRKERDDFINDIKELKQEINALNAQKTKRDNAIRTQTENYNYEIEIGKDQLTSETEPTNQEDAKGTKEPKNTLKTEETDSIRTCKNPDLSNLKREALKNCTHKNKNAKKPRSSNKPNNNNIQSNKGTNGATSTFSSSINGAAAAATVSGSGLPSIDDDLGFHMTAFHYIHSFIQMGFFSILGLCFKKLFFLCFTQGCVVAPTICSKWCFRRNRDMFWTISLTVFITSIVNPGIMNIREEYFPSTFKPHSDELDTMLEWIKMNTERDAVFAGPIEIIGTVHLTTRRPIVNHAHLEMRQILERTEHVYSVYSRQQSTDIYNQCSQLKIQYLIISVEDCTNQIKDECDLLHIWDEMQPSYRKYKQFCFELLHKNIPSFVKVFSNNYYSVVKLFSQSVQINLHRNIKMPEKVM